MNKETKDAELRIKQSIAKMAVNSRFQQTVEKLDAKSLLIVYLMLWCWSWDALIRICGISDDFDVTEKPESWKSVCKEATRRIVGLTFGSLAQMSLEYEDELSVCILGYQQRQLWIMHREIYKRIDSLKVAKALSRYVDSSPEFKLEDLCKAIKPPKFITVKGEHRSLSRSGEKWEDPLNKQRTLLRKREDEEGKNVGAAFEYFDKLKQEVEIGSLEKLPPYGPVKSRLPCENPLWEKVLPQIMQREVELWLREYLPMMQGKMEKAPFKAFNAHRTAARQDQRWTESTGAWKNLEEIENDDENPIMPLSKLEYEDAKRQKLDTKLESQVDISRAREKHLVRLELELVKAKVTKRSKIRRAIHLTLFEDKGAKEAAAIEKLSEKTVRKYMIKIGLSDDSDETPDH